MKRNTDTTFKPLIDGIASPIGFFESIKLNDMEGKWLRIPAAIQRRHFGSVPFGKKAVKVAEDGLVTVFHTVAFGHDWEEQNVRWDSCNHCWVYASDGTKALLP
jgi:hypothetical protein